MRVAVIGGWHVHTKQYADIIANNPNSQLACLWDDDPVRGQQLADEYKIPYEPNLEKIWADKTIDSVQITTATYQHTDILIAAAKAGKNIFTEKVLAFTNEEAEKIAAAVKESGVKFTISFIYESKPTLLAAKALVESGKLGQITYARVRDAHNGSTGGWLPPHFYDEKQTGGGAMIDLGAHPMYLLNWLLGEPVSIVSMFTEVTHKGVEDNAVSVIEFADGAIGVSETGFVSMGNPFMIEVSGTAGSLLIHNNTLEYSCEETDHKPVEMKDLPAELPCPLDGWIDAVTNGTEAPNGIDAAVSLTKFMVGAYEAYKTGKKYTF